VPSSTIYTGAVWDGGHTGCLMFDAYNHVNTPNNPSCSAKNSSDPFSGAPYDAITTASNHSGGVNIAFSDGSVRFIKNTINIQIWWALGSRNLGEIVSADQF
jgi:prepilin-type processing-associated H-X9-DG protein